MSPLTIGDQVCIQFLQALGEASPPTDWRLTSYDLDLRGVTQGYPLLVVLYRITLVSLVEYLRDVDPTVLSPFYTDNTVFDGSERRSESKL